MKLFVKGDLDGFFAFGLDAMLAFLLMGGLLIGFLGFPPALVYERVLPAAAMGLLVGNGFYSWQAIKLARKEGRVDVCAIPFGTSTLTLIIIVFLIMYPVQQQALAQGISKEAANVLSWHVGLLAGATTGFIEFAGSFFVYQLRRIVPRVVMLVAIAGTGLTFLTMDYAIRTFGTPLVGFATLALVILFYFAHWKARAGVPGGFVILAFGTVVAWLMHWTGYASVVPGPPIATEFFGLHLPRPEAQNVLSALPYAALYVPLIAPFGFIFLLGSLQNIEAAAAAGDNYEPRPLLVANGVSSLIAAAFGSPFPTSIFVGHPGYKRIGGRAGYTLINALVWTVICFTGTLSIVTHIIPVEAVMALIIWIGLIVFAQNFEISNSKHFMAIALGLVPAIAAYVSLAVRHVLSTAGQVSGQNFLTHEFAMKVTEGKNFYLEGLYALGEGYIYSSMVLAALVYYAIEGQFRKAASWALAGIVLTTTGFTHTFRYVSGDVLSDIHLPIPEWNMWASGYLLMAVIMFIAPWITQPKPVDPASED